MIFMCASPIFYVTTVLNSANTSTLMSKKKINNLSFQPLRKLTELQYNQNFLSLRNFLRMSFLSSRLFPLTRIVSLKAGQSLLRGISQNSTSAASKETLLLSDSCVKKLRDICDGQFLRVTVSRIYNSLAHIEQNNFLTQTYPFQLHFSPVSELRFKIWFVHPKMSLKTVLLISSLFFPVPFKAKSR